MSKNILMGITGGISAYKSLELIRLLREQDFSVRVVMTKHATEFVTPLSFQAISGHPVYTELMDDSHHNAMRHIELAKWADFILIAPASTNTISKVALGIADDLLSTTCLAFNKSIFIAPSMNKEMWECAPIQENMNKLISRGFHIIGPVNGSQACGDVGFGRMTEPVDIADQLQNALKNKQLLKNKKIVITAGSTQEAIDSIRYITNKSSGKMGYAIATAAQALGATVILISGKTAIKPPSDVTFIPVLSALEMQSAVLENINDADFFIATAAVANYRVENISSQKIKSHSEKLNLTLISNPDIIESVSKLSKNDLLWDLLLKQRT